MVVFKTAVALVASAVGVTLNVFGAQHDTTFVNVREFLSDDLTQTTSDVIFTLPNSEYW